ncbi:MAG TPA: rhomboid family intramembrane serine protease [Methyloceanibacter sp.]|nr:rhomboid family intramembrane serine protease [Methyloceanibacter sp.]
MFPISDDNPRRQTPIITWTIIGICVLVFLWQLSLGEDEGQIAVFEFGMIPARVFGGAELPPDFAYVPPWATVFTSMFMHGGFMHLALNMLFLWIFGDNVEDSMGHVRYLGFYLVCGIAAAMAQALTDPASTIPMIGASGAISGVLGAYLLLHPQATIRVLLVLGVFVTITHVPAVIVLGLWFLTQIASAAFTQSETGGVAFWAHVGGFVAGMALVPFFKQKDVPLFQPPLSRPFEIERRRGPWG